MGDGEGTAEEERRDEADRPDPACPEASRTSYSMDLYME